MDGSLSVSLGKILKSYDEKTHEYTLRDSNGAIVLRHNIDAGNNLSVLRSICHVICGITDNAVFTTYDPVSLYEDEVCPGTALCKICFQDKISAHKIDTLQIFYSGAYLCPVCGKKYADRDFAIRCCLSAVRYYYLCDNCKNVYFDWNELRSTKYITGLWYKIPQQYHFLIDREYDNVIRLHDDLFYKPEQSDLCILYINIALQYDLLFGMQNYVSDTYKDDWLQYGEYEKRIKDFLLNI